MEIETVDDLANQIADWLCVYGCCKNGDGDGCDDPNPLCCRIGFMMIFPDRIRKAVLNEYRLELIEEKKLKETIKEKVNENETTH